MHTGFFRQLFAKPHTRDIFEAQYRAGEWDFLNNLDELGRYSIIAGYCRRLGAKAILDVGCGHGVLAGELADLAYERYVGVDFSDQAVRAAQAAHDSGRNRFQVADAAAFEPDGRFDAVIFNECLYYLKDPARVAASYGRALNPGGRLIVSVHKTSHNEPVWAALAKVAEVEDGVTVTNQAGTAWVVKLLKPKS